mgnify:CR=1 FL=1
MTKSIPTEIAPSAKHLVFLVMIAAVVAVIIFLCGVLVGQGMPRRVSDSGVNGPVQDVVAPVEVAVPEMTPGPQGSSLDDLSYYNRLHSVGPVSEMLSKQSGVSNGERGFEVGESSGLPVGPVDGSPGVSFFLQVTALRGGVEAREVAALLAAKGYPAFVVDPVPAALVAMYRVRVGPYTERAVAEETRRRLETEERFKPWVIQPRGQAGHSRD